MKGYWIILGTDVVDADAQKEYSRLWAPISKKYGARVRLLEPGVLVESVTTKRVLVVEFPSYEQAKACNIDPDYAEARLIALRAYKREMIIIQGDLA